MLARISRVQTQLISMWDVLSTMTPFEYSAFRNALGRSSGFQSVQYRMLEFLLGNKNAEMVAVHQRDPEAYATLQRALEAPSLYDEVLRLLSRRGYGIPEDYLTRDFSEPYRASKQVAGAWLGVYHNAEKGLGPVRAGRAARRSRPQVPAVALPSPEDGGAHHRLQARHRRHRRGVLPGQGAGAEVLSGAVADSHVDVGSGGRWALIASLPAESRSAPPRRARRGAVHQQRLVGQAQVRQVAAGVAVRGEQPRGCWARSASKQRIFSAPRRLGVVRCPPVRRRPIARRCR